MYIYICKIKIDCIIVCIIVWYMLNMLFVKSKWIKIIKINDIEINRLKLLF